MTSQKDQIQALIAEIDSVLQKANSRLPWAMAGEIAQQRQVLERVRNYLIELQQQLPVEGLRQAETASPMGYPPEFYPSAARSGAPAAEVQQMMQTILQEMSYLRASVMQPMQADLENLRQRREVLTQELTHLEAERHHQTLAQRAVSQASNSQQFTDELVQVLMSRLQESLSQQIGQALGSQALTYGASFIRPGESLTGAVATPQYEQLQALRSRSDQMLVNLDGTLRIVFESLQRNVQAYQVSLTEGLERMHSLGQQSEVAFKAVIGELAQQLNQEASSYLLSLAQAQAVDPKTAIAHAEPLNPSPEPLLEPIADPAIGSNFSPSVSAPDRSMATDLSPTDLIGAAEKRLPPMPELDAALESWLRSADSSNVTDENTAELNTALNLLEELDSELISAPSPVANDSVEQDEFYQSLFGDIAVTQPDAATQLGQAEPEAIAPFSDLFNSFSPEATNSAALDSELDNINQSAILADITFDSIRTTVDLPELFAEGVAETATTSITELPASLLDDGSISAPTLEPFPLTAETESLLTDLDPFSSEPDSAGSLADLFQDLSQESARSTPIDPPAIARDWVSRQEAAPIADPLQSVQTDPLTIGLPDSEFALEGKEDQFTRAALDENLLPDANYEAGSVNLDLDDLTFNRLSEDLSNVETDLFGQFDRISDGLPSDNLPSDNFPSLDEFALFTQETPEPEPLIAPSMGDRADPASDAEDSLPFTLEGMDDLFSDAPLGQVPSLPISEPTLENPLPLSQLEDPEELLKEISRPSLADVSVQKGNNTPAAVSLPDSLPDSLPEDPPDSPVNLGLDEAFESLLGKPTPVQPAPLNQQTKEKKKTL